LEETYNKVSENGKKKLVLEKNEFDDKTKQILASKLSLPVIFNKNHLDGKGLLEYYTAVEDKMKKNTKNIENYFGVYVSTLSTFNLNDIREIAYYSDKKGFGALIERLKDGKVESKNNGELDKVINDYLQMKKLLGLPGFVDITGVKDDIIYVTGIVYKGDVKELENAFNDYKVFFKKMIAGEKISKEDFKLKMKFKNEVGKLSLISEEIIIRKDYIKNAEVKPLDPNKEILPLIKTGKSLINDLTKELNNGEKELDKVTKMMKKVNKDLKTLYITKEKKMDPVNSALIMGVFYPEVLRAIKVLDKVNGGVIRNFLKHNTKSLNGLIKSNIYTYGVKSLNLCKGIEIKLSDSKDLVVV